MLFYTRGFMLKRIILGFATILLLTPTVLATPPSQSVGGPTTTTPNILSQGNEVEVTNAEIVKYMGFHIGLSEIYFVPGLGPVHVLDIKPGRQS